MERQESSTKFGVGAIFRLGAMPHELGTCAQAATCIRACHGLSPRGKCTGTFILSKYGCVTSIAILYGHCGPPHGQGSWRGHPWQWPRPRFHQSQHFHPCSGCLRCYDRCRRRCRRRPSEHDAGFHQARTGNGVMHLHCAFQQGASSHAPWPVHE